ncbi:MAG TPA: DUF664 domain-containing protein [Streptosporangiaceae bacterium]|nr:DUF664 domain-containing protein [Streptosporangiaceae bacterium]
MGYGDKYPVSPGGRGVAVVLMLVGIGLISVLTATVASYFVEEKADQEKAELNQRLDRIEAMLARALAPPDKPGAAIAPGRPCPQDQLPWDEADPLSDMWASPAESREFNTGRYRRAWVHSDATIEALTLDAIGHVPWWPPDRNEVTLHHILVRLATDTGRHAGQADIIRELIDGTAGRTRENTNLPSADQAWWQAHRDQVERAAKDAAKAGNE